MADSLKSLKARPAVESVPRYQKGSLIVTRTRRQNLAYVFTGAIIGLGICAYPVLLALISKAF